MADKAPVTIDTLTGRPRQFTSADNMRTAATVQFTNSLTVGSTLTVNASTDLSGGSVTMRKALFLTEDCTMTLTTAGSPWLAWTPTTLTTGTCVRADVTSPAVVSSMVFPGGADGFIYTVHNIATALANTLTFTHDDGVTGTASQRFLLPGGASLVLGPGDSVTFRYDATSSRYRVISQGASTFLPSTPTRALDTTFTPSATNYTLCSYTIEFATAAGNDGSVELRSDTASPPTTVRESARSALVGGTSITIRQTLRYLCPPAHTIKLVTAGTGTITIAHQTEVSFL